LLVSEVIILVIIPPRCFAFNRYYASENGKRV